MNNMNELEEMRQQIKALKDKVERKGTLNERLVMDSIKTKMKSIHRTVYKMIALSVIVTPVWLMIKMQYNLSWPFFIATILMMYVSVFLDWHINRMDISNMGTDLKETARKLVEMKRLRSRNEKIGLMVVVPLWLIWMGYEFYHNMSDTNLAIIMITGCVIGGAVGGAIGVSIFFKWQRKNDEMLDQIKAISDEEE